MPYIKSKLMKQNSCKQFYRINLYIFKNTKDYYLRNAFACYFIYCNSDNGHSAFPNA